MDGSPLGALVGTMFAGIGGALLVVAVFVGIFGWPILLISAVRSLRRIARELERANDYREHYDHGARPAALGEPNASALPNSLRRL